MSAQVERSTSDTNNDEEVEDAGQAKLISCIEVSKINFYLINNN